MTVLEAQDIERIRIARERVMAAGVSARARGGNIAAANIALAVADLNSAIDHLEAAYRLTDPAAAGSLARRADESFDRGILKADPRPSWTGGLLGSDRPENNPPESRTDQPS